MSGYERRQKPAGCYQMKFGNVPGQPCCHPNEIDSGRRGEEGMEMANRCCKGNEHARPNPCPPKGHPDQASKTARRPCNKACIAAPKPVCKQNTLGRREAVRRLSNIPPCPGARPKGASGLNDLGMPTLPPACKQDFSDAAKPKELPKKPELSINQLSHLVAQEAEDVNSVWALTSENAESYKKPCPKQQKAKEAVKAITEPKKAEEPMTCLPQILLKPPPLPLIDPNPDDITPEVAANMMFVHERGIKMVESPEATVKHLFPDQLGDEEEEGKKAGEGKDKDAKGADETQSGEGAVEDSDVDDSVFTRNMSQRESGEDDVTSSNLDAGAKKHEKKGEFVLKEKAAKCINKVQLRGDNAPWFPGYLVSFPDQSGISGVEVARSPSGVFQRAWMAAKPSNIPTTEIFLVE